MQDLKANREPSGFPTDLSKPIKNITPTILSSFWIYTKKIFIFLTAEEVDKHSAEMLTEKNITAQYTYQFRNTDKYIFAEPMWNPSVPSVLKAYIDYISIPGITFKYSENGTVGLCKGEKNRKYHHKRRGLQRRNGSGMGDVRQIPQSHSGAFRRYGLYYHFRY